MIYKITLANIKKKTKWGWEWKYMLLVGVYGDINAMEITMEIYQNTKIKSII